MVSSRFIRRLQKILSHPIFTAIVSLLIIAILIALAIYFKPKNNTEANQSMVSPQVVQDLIVNLVSLPESATGSGALLAEYRLRHSAPFQVMNLSSSGQLTELDPAASTSAEAVIFVSKSLPDQSTTARLYGYWKELKTSATSYDSLWLSDTHFGLLLSDLLVIFGDTDPATGLATLQQIRSHSTMTLHNTLIDLRFDKPVISENQISIE